MAYFYTTNLPQQLEAHCYIIMENCNWIIVSKLKSARKEIVRLKRNLRILTLQIDMMLYILPFMIPVASPKVTKFEKVRFNHYLRLILFY